MQLLAAVADSVPKIHKRDKKKITSVLFFIDLFFHALGSQATKQSHSVRARAGIGSGVGRGSRPGETEVRAARSPARRRGERLPCPAVDLQCVHCPRVNPSSAHERFRGSQDSGRAVER